MGDGSSENARHFPSARRTGIADAKRMRVGQKGAGIKYENKQSGSLRARNGAMRRRNSEGRVHDRKADAELICSVASIRSGRRYPAFDVRWSWRGHLSFPSGAVQFSL
jgi:hypothetical protein